MMIQIDENDMPIDVAQKLIKATKPYEPSPFEKIIRKIDLLNPPMVDMFSLKELKEIADYLIVYCSDNEEDEAK